LYHFLATLLYRGELLSSILSDDDNPNDIHEENFTSCLLLLDLLKGCHILQSKHGVYSDNDRGEGNIHDNKEGDGYSMNNGINITSNGNTNKDRKYKRK